METTMETIEYAGDQMAKEYRFWLMDRVMDYRMDLFEVCCKETNTEACVAAVKAAYSDTINRLMAYAHKPN